MTKQEASEQLARYILDSDCERDNYEEHILENHPTSHPYYWAAIILECTDEFQEDLDNAEG